MGTAVRTPRAALLLPVLGPLALLGAACTTAHPGTDTARPARQVDVAPLIRMTPAAGGTADPAIPLTVTVVRGRLTDVTVTDAAGRQVAGGLSADQRSWHSTSPLGAGTRYTVRISADDGHGGRGDITTVLTTGVGTQLLTAVLGPSQAVDGGSGVYGVGEPVTAQLSRPVHDPAGRAAVEHGLKVTSQPAVSGAWHWVDDSTLHFRPEHYWPAHARVQVAFDAQGRRIGKDLYGGATSRVAFSTGDQVEALVDAATDWMTFRRNGKVVRTLPVTTGKPGFETRNGIKVVLGQEAEVRMDGETVGIAADSADSYDLEVQWATRLTWSGEYVHAAPWSVASQGHENVSHGCTGMSTENAHWFYQQVRMGDVLRVINSHGHPMEPFGNGFGDWNVSWKDWLAGSATGAVVSTGAPGAALPDGVRIRATGALAPLL